MKNDYNIIIRPITPADQGAVVSIYKNGWLETYPNKAHGISTKDVQEAVAFFSTTAIHKNKFVAELSGEVVGVISVKEGNPNVIQSLYVARPQQGKGVGTALLQFAIEKFGSGAYALQVAAYNTEAIDFYKKFGFEPAANSLGSTRINILEIPQITMIRQSAV